MRFSVSVALLFLAGGAMSKPQGDTCTPSDAYYGEEACEQNCQGGTCSLREDMEDEPDYICSCPELGPGCGELVKGKDTCEDICTQGDCTLLLLIYECKCP